ncbi:hypothetical protein [Solirubrobacter soli]|uniref:hypothetical protein n=1 Tax=Solirubrobacter soli TaxID=363832 RepID=UPI0004899519|nr:hypothetical protein [Solirubrobacter soli]
MSKPFRLTAATLAIAALAPATASAAWTAPTPLSTATEANPIAQGAFGGSVLTGWLKPTVALSKNLGAPAAITAADPFEKAWAAGLDRDGNAVVLTVRKHAPFQRIRATFVAADGTRSATRTISTDPHSSAQPLLSVAPDGTAAAAWVWHDPAGWRAQVAVRKPGQAAFGKPQTVSPPAPLQGRYATRPVLNVAAGDGGRAAVTWQFSAGQETPLHVLTAVDRTFGTDQALPGTSGYADVGLAVGTDGAVQLAWLDAHFNGHASSLNVAQGTAGSPLAAPAVLSSGGKGISSGDQVEATFSADGTATVAWAKPGNSYEAGGTLEVFTRAAGGAFGAAQTVAEGAEGVALAGGPDDSAVLAWMRYVGRRPIVEAVTRAQTGGAFGAAETLSAAGSNALWPSVAMTPAGDAVAVWVTNTSGGGDGIPTAAINH